MDSEEVQPMETPSTSPKVGKKSEVGLGRQLMHAIRKLQGGKGDQGTTLASIKTFLSNEKNVDTKQRDAEIKMYLKNALDRGQLFREAGKYRVAAGAHQKKRSGGRSKRSPKRSRKVAGPKATKNTAKPRAKRSKRKSSPRRSQK